MRGIGENRARDGHALALPARQLARHARRRSCRILFSKRSMNSSQCAIRLAARISSRRRARFGERDVLGDRAVEEEVVLHHDARDAGGSRAVGRRRDRGRRP